MKNVEHILKLEIDESWPSVKYFVITILLFAGSILVSFEARSAAPIFFISWFILMNYIHEKFKNLFKVVVHIHHMLENRGEKK